MMSFIEILEEERVKIEKQIGEFFDQYLQSGMLKSQFVQQFYSDLKNYILNGGKRLRPISLVMTYKGFGGKKESIYEPAISVELLHNASLVHDDIIDHDLIRRGQPSFHAFYQQWFAKHVKESSEQSDFGLAMGILGGDLLIDLGQDAILNSDFDRKLEAVTYYLQSFKELINGVLFESYLQSRPLEKVTVNDYLDMITGKTAALFEKSLLIGQVLADKNERYRKELSDFSILLGQSFQIRDDILGVFGDAKKTGKSIEGDIREGKKTLLAIYGSKSSEMKVLYGKKDITSEEVEAVRQLLRDSGALEKTKGMALKLSERASEILGSIDLEQRSFLFFNELVKFVQERFI